MNKIQEFCYDNINFLKTFHKVIFMLYNGKIRIHAACEHALVNAILPTKLQHSGTLNSLGNDVYSIPNNGPVSSGNVLEEDAIVEWFKTSHSTKGQTEFLSQMEKMVNWLENAEEGLFCLF